MLTSAILFLLVLPFCISLVPPSPPSPLALENELLTILNMGNDTNNPFHFYQTSNVMDASNFGLTTAWPPPQQPPSSFRPIPSGASMQILLSIITQSFAPLPPSDPVGKNYLEWSPDYRPNMNHLDMRIAIRQIVIYPMAAQPVRMYHENHSSGTQPAEAHSTDIMSALGEPNILRSELDLKISLRGSKPMHTGKRVEALSSVTAPREPLATKKL
ncbi:MAG: hypothetical protein LQ337_002456 [Flavoplaca oasis]|nr:MAG: hypothetical protein LQ337_002456 [Flavoplaca oasis]